MMKIKNLAASSIVLLAGCTASRQESQISTAEVDAAQHAYLECAVAKASRMAHVPETANIIAQSAIS
jgi:hypothetical protein